MSVDWQEACRATSSDKVSVHLSRFLEHFRGLDKAAREELSIQICGVLRGWFTQVNFGLPLSGPTVDFKPAPTSDSEVARLLASLIGELFELDDALFASTLTWTARNGKKLGVDTRFLTALLKHARTGHREDLIWNSLPELCTQPEPSAYPITTMLKFYPERKMELIEMLLRTDAAASREGWQMKLEAWNDSEWADFGRLFARLELREKRRLLGMLGCNRLDRLPGALEICLSTQDPDLLVEVLENFRQNGARLQDLESVLRITEGLGDTRVEELRGRLKTRIDDHLLPHHCCQFDLKEAARIEQVNDWRELIGQLRVASSEGEIVVFGPSHFYVFDCLKDSLTKEYTTYVKNDCVAVQATGTGEVLFTRPWLLYTAVYLYQPGWAKLKFITLTSKKGAPPKGRLYGSAGQVGWVSKQVDGGWMSLHDIDKIQIPSVLGIDRTVFPDRAGFKPLVDAPLVTPRAGVGGELWCCDRTGQELYPVGRSENGLGRICSTRGWTTLGCEILESGRLQVIVWNT